MATSTPSATTTVGPETSTRSLVDYGRDEPSAVTASRAVPPSVIVQNRHLSTKTFGEAYLMWRCLECGTMGSLAALPSHCVCGASREALSYVIDD